MRVLVVCGPIHTGVRAHVSALERAGEDVWLLAEDWNSADARRGCGELEHRGRLMMREQLSAQRSVRLGLMFERITALGIEGAARLLWMLSRIDEWGAYSAVHVEMIVWYMVMLGDDLRRWDVIHVHDLSLGRRMAILKAAGWVDGVLVCSVNGQDILSYGEAFARARYKHLFSQVSAVTAQSEYTRGAVLRAGLEQGRLWKVSPPLDMRACVSRPPRAALIGGVRLLCVGRLTELKGYRYAVEAVQVLRGRAREATLTIIGTGAEEEALREQIDALGLSGVVRLLGALPLAEVYEEMARHDIFLHPCITLEGGAAEALSFVTMEAQCVGLPCVVTSSGGVAESIVEGVSGIVVDERSAAAVADGVAQLVDVLHSWGERVEAGRRFVEQNFSAEVVVQRYQEIYKEVVDRS